MVLDEVNGRWIGVTVTQGRCNSQTLDKWEVMSFELQPGGTLSGDYSYFYPMRCSGKRTVTFTRTGDITGTDGVADPSGEAARVASPAEALYGSYQLTQTFPTSKTTDNVRVHTYCLRSGDRCVSYFYGDNLWPMTFANDSWTANFTFDGKCPSGGTSHVTITAEFPLPQTHPNPIATLTGNGRQDSVGTACSGSDFDAEFVRTGD
jgi:hypothetical protein